jgi:two-component system, OmpR family, sensor histidine kinase QseC
VAHELRTPLAALVWQARLARSTPDTHEQTRALQQLETEALRAGHILTQLLDLARAQGVARQPLQTLDLCTWVGQQLALLAPQSHAATHELALVAPEGPLRVSAQPLMLELALRNLLDNALRHTPAGTRVWVELQSPLQGGVTLAVCDDGQARSHASCGPPTAGLGLGLTLVQRLAQEQGLSFFKDEAPLQGGSRYVLQWPAADREGVLPL